MSRPLARTPWVAGLLVGLLVLGALASGQARSPKQVRIALIVATSHSRNGQGVLLEVLDQVPATGRLLGDRLHNHAYFIEVRLLENPTGQQLLDEIPRLAEWLRRHYPGLDVLLYVHLIGHGEGRSLLLVDGPLEFRRLRDALAQVPAKLRFTVVDACDSEEMVTMGQGKVLDEYLPMEGEVCFVSASKGEKPRYSHEPGLGPIYTHHLSRLMIEGTQARTLWDLHLEAAELTKARAADQHPKLIFGQNTKIERWPVWNGQRDQAGLADATGLPDCRFTPLYGGEEVQTSLHTLGRWSDALAAECDGQSMQLDLPGPVQQEDSLLVLHPVGRPPAGVGGYVKRTGPTMAARQPSARQDSSLGPAISAAPAVGVAEVVPLPELAATLFEPGFTLLVGLVGGLTSESGETVLADRSGGIEVRGYLGRWGAGLRLHGGVGQTTHPSWSSEQASLGGVLHLGHGWQFWQPMPLRLELRGQVSLDHWWQEYDDGMQRVGWSQQLGGELSLLWSASDRLRVELALQGGGAHAPGTMADSASSWVPTLGLQLGLFWQR